MFFRITFIMHIFQHENVNKTVLTKENLLFIIPRIIWIRKKISWNYEK